MHRIIIYIVVLIVVHSGVGHVIARENAENVCIKPNQDVQSFLHGLSSTNLQERQKLFSTGTKEELRQKLFDIQKIAGGEKEMALQLMYFHSHANGMQEAMLAGFVLDQLAITNSIFFDVCLPMLDSNDESTRELAADWLTRADHVSKGGVDFSRYESILREKKDNPPQGLIRYMYNRNPQTAVATVARVYGKDVPESDVAAKAKSGVKNSVEYFSARPEWWAHLYVATMMEKEPYLRTPELIKKLEQDTDPLVREKVSKMKFNLKPSK